jgi:hypothetical protein
MENAENQFQICNSNLCEIKNIIINSELKIMLEVQPHEDGIKNMNASVQLTLFPTYLQKREDE